MMNSPHLDAPAPQARPKTARQSLIRVNRSMPRRGRANAEKAIIEVKNLTIGWDDTIVQKDLNFAVEIVACPIVREADGLAMSSRNAYLNREERGRALVLQWSLQEARQQFDAGERAAAKLISAAKEVFAGEPQVVLDYFEIVDPDTLDPVERISQKTLVAVAAYVGTTRLIDNLVLNP